MSFFNVTIIIFHDEKLSLLFLIFFNKNIVSLFVLWISFT